MNKTNLLLTFCLLANLFGCTNADKPKPAAAEDSENNNAFSKEKILSPKPPPPGLSTSLPPQQSMLPPAPNNLKLEQGYFQATDGVQLFYRMVGSGKDTIVFIHGGPGVGIHDGAMDIELLANKGYTFIEYDQRGCGRSELVRDSTKLTMDDYVEELEALRQHFNIQKLTPIGLSWGAAIVTNYINRFPQRVRRLVFLSPMEPAAELDKRKESIDAALGKTKTKQIDSLFRLMEKTTNDTIYRTLFVNYLSIYLSAYVTEASHLDRARGNDAEVSPLAIRNGNQPLARWSGLSNQWDFRPMLKHISVPVLVIEGAKTNVPLSATKEYVRIIKNAKLVLVPNAGHQNWLDQPEEVLNALDKFFKSTLD